MRVWGLVIFGLTGVGILCILGFWQLDRLAWKRNQLWAIESQINAPPGPLPTIYKIHEPQMQPVEISGHYVGTGYVRVLVSQKIHGAGYRVIHPFVTDTGERVLVDRGYIKTHAEIDIPTGPHRLIGNLHWPDERDGFTPENDVANNIWFARDVLQLAEHFETKPILVILRRSTPQGTAVSPLPLGTDGIPNDHLQYAITWFSLALIWLVMTGYLLYRRQGNVKAG